MYREEAVVVGCRLLLDDVKKIGFVAAFNLRVHSYSRPRRYSTARHSSGLKAISFYKVKTKSKINIIACFWMIVQEMVQNLRNDTWQFRSQSKRHQFL